MQNLRADKWMRVGSGVAVLLLVAVHENAWPALTSPPPEPVKPAPREPGEKPRVFLRQSLPDAPAPRWPAIWTHALSRETTGVRDGVQPAGPRDVAAAAGLPAPGRPAWHAYLLPLEPAGLVSQSPERTPAAAAVLTAICPTGPPQS